MDYHYLNSLRLSHPAWRLLAAKHAPLVISFLHQAFIEPNVRTLSEAELIARLEDTLYAINAGSETALYPKPAREYLKDWAEDDKGWLRRFYPLQSTARYASLLPSDSRHEVRSYNFLHYFAWAFHIESKSSTNSTPSGRCLSQAHGIRLTRDPEDVGDIFSVRSTQPFRPGVMT